MIEQKNQINKNALNEEIQGGKNVKNSEEKEHRTYK